MRRHPARSAGRSSLLLLSVLALLALACFPVAAQAEVQYEDEVPSVKVPPSTHKNTQHHSGSEAEISNTNPQHSKGSGGSPGSGGGSSGGSSSTAGHNPSTGGGQGAGQGGSGNGAPAGGKANSPHQGQATGTPSSSSEGGSSPLVPILIAIAILAAISVGALVYRQRRQGDKGSGTVSSPEPN
jgi:cobalamin biosynthesis Mg chelatase CobN